MIKRTIHNYINWFFNAYLFTTLQLSFFRILFLSSIFVVTGVPQYMDKIANFPDGFFNPPPLFSAFFDQIPPLVFFQVSDVLIYLCLFFVLIGLFTKYAGIVGSVLVIISNGFIYSTGKIDHSFLLWFALFILSFSGWGHKLSINSILFKHKKEEPRNWTVSLFSLAIGFSFFTAGFIKFVSGWLSSSEAMLRGFFLRNYYVQNKQNYLAPYFENFDFFPFWEAGDWFTIIFEMLFVYAVFRTANFRFFTVLAVFFHGLVLLLFNIAFSSYMIIYVLFWIPVLPSSFWTKLSSISDRIKTFHLLVFGGTVFGINLGLKTMELGLIINHSYLILFFFVALFVLFIKPSWIFRDTALGLQKKGVIRFDGVCNLCNGFVQFVISKDNRDIFRFKTLQSNEEENEPEQETNYSTILLEKHDLQYDKSDAFANIVRELKSGWSYLYLTTFVPKFIRNFVYTIVAKNRYKMFGKQDSCMLPTENLKKKFL
jgi:predicted DCC family thiol-disulfide oxidoreductase YuxK